jgi:hypothetical protein
MERRMFGEEKYYPGILESLVQILRITVVPNHFAYPIRGKIIKLTNKHMGLFRRM